LARPLQRHDRNFQLLSTCRFRHVCLCLCECNFARFYIHSIILGYKIEKFSCTNLNGRHGRGGREWEVRGRMHAGCNFQFVGNFILYSEIQVKTSLPKNVLACKWFSLWPVIARSPGPSWPGRHRKKLASSWISLN